MASGTLQVSSKHWVIYKHTGILVVNMGVLLEYLLLRLRH